MSTLELNLITGVVTHCAHAVRTLEEILADLTQAVVSAEQAFANARAAQRGYLQEALTHAAGQTMSQLGPCLVREAAIPQLRQNALAMLNARTTIGVQIAKNQLSAAVHQEQQQIARDLAPLVIHASDAVGFPATALEQPGRVLVIGQDQGRALQHELLVVKNQPLTLRSETMAFHDESCHAVLDQFQDELRKRGVRLQSDKPDSKQRLRQRQAMRVGQ